MSNLLFSFYLVYKDYKWFALAADMTSSYVADVADHRGMVIVSDNLRTTVHWLQAW